LEVEAKELENRLAVLTATVEDEWLDPFLRTASRRLAGRVEIPGFRKGKAPHRVVVQRMGREALVREVIDDVGRAAYEQAVEESGLDPIRLEDLDIADWDPLTLRMTVSLKPVVELGDYRNEHVKLEEVNVEEEEVEAVLRDIQERFAEMVSVDRPAALGDFALVDVEGTLRDRVVLKLEEEEYELRTEGEFLVAEFGKELAGTSAGEDRTFSVTFPDDYEDEDLSGQEVAFRVHVRSLQEKHLPKVDDELAKMVGGFGSLEELRLKIREDLHRQREAEQKDELAESVLDSLSEEANVDLPPLFVDAELETMVGALVRDLQEKGFTLEGYLNATARTMEALLDEFRPNAEKSVKKSLILSKLVEEEDLDVDDAEIEGDVDRITRAYGQDTQALRDALLGSEQVREDVRNRLYGRKMVERLAELSTGPDEKGMDESSVEADDDERSREVEEKQASSEEVGTE